MMNDGSMMGTDHTGWMMGGMGWMMGGMGLFGLLGIVVLVLVAFGLIKYLRT